MKRKLAGILCLLMLLEEITPSMQLYAADVPEAAYTEEYAAESVSEDGAEAVTGEDSGEAAVPEETEAEDGSEAEQPEASDEADTAAGEEEPDITAVEGEQPEASDDDAGQEEEQPDISAADGAAYSNEDLVLLDGDDEITGSLTLLAGSKRRISVKAVDGVDELYLSYASSNTKYAKVDNNGVITAVKSNDNGTAVKITVTSRNAAGKVCAESTLDLSIKSAPATSTLTIDADDRDTFDFLRLYKDESGSPAVSVNVCLDAKTYAQLKLNDYLPKGHERDFFSTAGSTVETAVEVVSVDEVLSDGVTASMRVHVRPAGPGIVRLGVNVGSKSASLQLTINQNTDGSSSMNEVWIGGERAAGWVGNKIYSSSTLTNPIKKYFLPEELESAVVLTGSEAIKFATKFYTQGAVTEKKKNTYPGAYFYVNAGTHLPEYGVFACGGKYYAVSGDSFGLLHSKGSSYLEMNDVPGMEDYLVSTTGEVITGGVYFDKSMNSVGSVSQADIYAYCDPGAGGRLVEQGWVPYNGGYTYINKYANTRRYSYRVLKTKSILSLIDTDYAAKLEAEKNDTKEYQNGLQYIGGKYYFLKDDVRLTGWIRLSKKGELVSETDKNGYLYYADPDSGEIDFTSGYFTVGKTKYWQGRRWYNGNLDGESGTGVARSKKELALVNISEEREPQWICVDTEGVINDDLLVNGGKGGYIAAGSMDWSHKGPFWVDSSVEGGLYKGYKIVNGTMYLFTPGAEKYSTDAAGGVVAIPVSDNNCYYSVTKLPVDMDTRGVQSQLYVSSKEGDIRLYADEKKKALTNALVILDGKRYYYNGDGKPVSGLIKAKKGTDVSWIYADARTGVINLKEGKIDYKNKSYYLNENGMVVTRAMTKDKAGILAIDNVSYAVDSSGAFQSGIQTINKHKYYFDTKTYARVEGEVVDVKGKKYYAAADTGELGGDKMGLVLDGEGNPRFWVNKDGTLKQGWIMLDGVKSGARLVNRKKALWTGYFNGEGFLADDGTIYKIGNKYYGFNGYGKQRSGGVWDSGDGVTYYSLDTGISETHEGNFSFLFNNSDGSMCTGWVKINKTDSRKKYFATTGLTAYDSNGEAKYFPMGSMLSGASLNISKKLYKFDSDGSWEQTKSGRVKDSDNKNYIYTEAGSGAAVRSALRRTGSNWYYYGADGKATSAVANGCFKDLNGSTVYPVFAKNGTFTGVSTRSGFLLTNTVVVVNGSQYIGLNEKGKPATGIVSGLLPNGSRRVLFIQADGTARKAAASSELILVGSDYYILGSDGFIRTAADYSGEGDGTRVISTFLPDGSGEAALDLCSLSAADRSVYQAAAAATKDGSIKLAVSADGKLARNATIYLKGGVVRKTGKYGIVIDGLIYMNGSRVYTSLKSTPGIGGKLLSTGQSVSGIKLRVKTNGELVCFTDSAGNKLSGVYEMTLEGNRLLVNLKNGKPAGGKATVNIGGSKVSYLFDSYVPIRLL